MVYAEQIGGQIRGRASDRKLMKLVTWNKSTYWETKGGNGKKEVSETSTGLAGKQQDSEYTKHMSFDG